MEEVPGLNGRAESVSQLASASPSPEAEYLRQVALAAREYKALSYELLQIQPGMRVLDVGCGVGVDLVALAERVGPHGLVVGIDPDPALLWEAHAVTAGRGTIQLGLGRAEHLGGDDGSFDRVRADWVLQDVPRPQIAIAEMWRMLGPGGLLELIEPDWKTIALFPGSPAGGDDDHTVGLVLQWYQRHLPHALMGRQLCGLLQQQVRREFVEVQMGALIWSSWRIADGILRISSAARALAEEEPAWAAEIDAWLQAVEAAAQHGEFLASLPLFFARAWKERYQPLSGRPHQGSGSLPF
jgi:ubiquinone/menaquinone biosynthesis C-methylase UbiE